MSWNSIQGTMHDPTEVWLLKQQSSYRYCKAVPDGHKYHPTRSGWRVIRRFAAMESLLAYCGRVGIYRPEEMETSS